jgi:nicotinamidase-related amidase
VYVVDEHDEDDPDLLAWGRHAVRGSPGAAIWHELAPAAPDLVVAKPSYSAFFRSELEVVLDRLGVDTLILVGCLTELGILATATDAMQRGFAVEVPPDSQAGSSAMAEDAALGVVRVMAPFGPARQARLDRRAA